MNLPKMIRRSQLIGVIFLVFFAVLFYRFYVLQVVEAHEYQERAATLYEQEAVLEASRGSIYDRNGYPLAVDTKAYTVIAVLDKRVPHHVEDVHTTAGELSKVLDMPVSRLEELLSLDRYQVEIRPREWYVTPETKEAIEQLALPGIIFADATMRYYPNNTFASHLLGFLNREGEPAMGLEASHNEYLQGHDGAIQFRKDNRGNRLPAGIDGITEPIDGHDMYLTIDERIQLYVEQAMDEVMAEYDPLSMSIVVSNPHTGEILAMSSRPSFNPNRYHDIENYANHAISSPFEPGSTFKIVTLAGAIEEGLFQADHTFPSGTYRGVPGEPIRDHRPEGWGNITYLEGVQRSSNVGFVLLQEMLGIDRFYDYVHRFGFGELTGIDLANEHPGTVRPAAQSPRRDIATMAFGHSLSVTAVQQIQAINVIANGGKLLKPYVIQEIVHEDQDELVLQNGVQVMNEQVISPETAAEVRDILETVVTDGTGVNYYLDGYQVAGKTGTAQKIGEDGTYQKQYIHSFSGFAPKDDPKLSIFVTIDSPKLPPAGNSVTLGGAVVAQAFKAVMLPGLQYMNVIPDEVREIEHAESGTEWLEMNDYTSSSPMTARQAAEADGFRVLLIGEGTDITDQIPAPGVPVLPGETVYFLSGNTERTHVPDFSDWSLREVLDWAALADVEIVVDGRGYALEQSVTEGAVIRRGDRVKVTFAPRMRVAVENNTLDPDDPDTGNQDNDNS